MKFLRAFLGNEKVMMYYTATIVDTTVVTVQYAYSTVQRCTWLHCSLAVEAQPPSPHTARPAVAKNA